MGRVKYSSDGIRIRPYRPLKRTKKAKAVRRKRLHIQLQVNEDSESAHAIQSSGNPVTKILSPAEMETHIFQKAKTRAEYLGLTARLITHIQEMKPPAAPLVVKEERPDSPPEQMTDFYSFSPTPPTSEAFNINDITEAETCVDDTPADSRTALIAIKEERPDTPPGHETGFFSLSSNPPTSQAVNTNEIAADEETCIDDIPAVAPRAKRKRTMQDVWNLELEEHELRMKVMQKKLELLEKKLRHEDDLHALRMKNLDGAHSTQMTSAINIQKKS